MTEKIKVDGVMLCEGKYDKIKLESIFSCTIIPTHGFHIFKDREKLRLIGELAQKLPIYIVTDSDSAGFKIRNFLKNTLQGATIHHVYVPDIYGKERRKTNFSKEGKLGVEGIDREILVKAVLQVAAPKKGTVKQEPLTQLDFYRLGFCGGQNSAQLRREALQRCNLPQNLSTKAFLEVMNILHTKKEALELLQGGE